MHDLGLRLLFVHGAPIFFPGFRFARGIRTFVLEVFFVLVFLVLCQSAALDDFVLDDEIALHDVFHEVAPMKIGQGLFFVEIGFALHPFALFSVPSLEYAGNHVHVIFL